HHGPEHHDVPVGTGGRQGGDQVDVHALIDNAAVAEPRMRYRGLIGRLGVRFARTCEEVTLDTAGKTMDGRMLALLGSIQALPARKDKVGAPEELRFRSS